MSKKNSSDTIGNLTRDPPTCSELHEPNYYYYYYYYYYYFVAIVIMIITIVDLGSVWAPLLSCSTCCLQPTFNSSVWAPLPSCSTYCLQPTFNSHTIPRSLQCHRYFTNPSFLSENATVLGKKVRRSGTPKITAVIICQFMSWRLWRFILRCGGWLQTFRKHLKPDDGGGMLLRKVYQTPITRNNVVMYKLRWTFKFRAYTGSFYLTTTSRHFLSAHLSY